MGMPASLVRAESLVQDQHPGFLTPSDSSGSHTLSFEWGFLPLRGMLVEVTSAPDSAALTVAVDLVRDAQKCGTPCAWISVQESSVYAPDIAGNGVDLSSLLAVRVPEVSAAARSAEYLARTGGFGLIVADFTAGTAREIDASFAARLVRMCRADGLVLLCLIREGTLGSLVSLRVAPRREHRQGEFFTVLEVVKDRRHGPGTAVRERRYGPDRLR